MTINTLTMCTYLNKMTNLMLAHKYKNNIWTILSAVHLHIG